jgi:SAM-dependent methyltransferase
MAAIRKSYGAHFAAASVAANYVHRPPYSPEVYATLEGLMPVTARALLDAGCGPGKIARGLVTVCERVDAVDPSGEMIAIGRGEPGGGDPKIHWQQATIEEAVLTPPYGLITAGASFHWMDAPKVLSLFAKMLAPSGVFAAIEGDHPADPPWRAAENAIFSDFIERLQGQKPNFAATSREQLERTIVDHPQFERLGVRITAPFAVRQRIADYLACQHSRATWSADFMGPEMTSEFDARLSELLEGHARGGVLEYVVQTRIEWGRPRAA